MTGRLEQLAANLATVTARIEAACADVGRDPAEVTIVAITKTRPAEDVAHLAALGIREVGESRDQEARPKAEQCAALGLRWHFVGQLQRNKASSVAQYADVVQSVDRAGLVGALDRAAQAAGRRVGVCLQVDLAPAGSTGAGRGGAPVEELPALAALVAGSGALDLLGVMAVAPLGVDPADPFARLAGIHADLLREHPQAVMRSAGMSGDLEAAIHAGATHVRIGSALLGHREALK